MVENPLHDDNVTWNVDLSWYLYPENGVSAFGGLAIPTDFGPAWFVARFIERREGFGRSREILEKMRAVSPIPIPSNAVITENHVLPSYLLMPVTDHSVAHRPALLRKCGDLVVVLLQTWLDGQLDHDFSCDESNRPAVFLVRTKGPESTTIWAAPRDMVDGLIDEAGNRLPKLEEIIPESVGILGWRSSKMKNVAAGLKRSRPGFSPFRKKETSLASHPQFAALEGFIEAAIRSNEYLLIV